MNYSDIQQAFLDFLLAVEKEGGRVESVGLRVYEAPASPVTIWGVPFTVSFEHRFKYIGEWLL